MVDLKTDAVANSLAKVAAARRITSIEAWDYGWQDAAYRSSAKAAATHSVNENVAFDQEVIPIFEATCRDLLRIPTIRNNYDEGDFWGILISLIATIPLRIQGDDLLEVVKQRLADLSNPTPTFVLMPVANIAPMASRLQVGPLTLGHFDDNYLQLIETKTGRRFPTESKESPWWLTVTEKDLPAPIVLAHETKMQFQRAVHDATEAFEGLVSLALMLQADLDALHLFSLRGDTNRPGIRGLSMDRAALDQLTYTCNRLSNELHCPYLFVTASHARNNVSWFSTAPLPIEKLLSGGGMRDAAQDVIFGGGALHRRLRVAALWHAKAHWALDSKEAVLSLGICFDSMLSEQSPSPGRVLAERFALLHDGAEVRRNCYQVFQREYYSTRSAIAHGAGIKEIDYRLVRQMAKDARWVFSKLLHLSKKHPLVTEDDLQTMFEKLKWGDGGWSADALPCTSKLQF